MFGKAIFNVRTLILIRPLVDYLALAFGVLLPSLVTSVYSARPITMIKLLKDCPSSAFGVLFSHPEFHSTCPITMTKLLEDCPSSVLSVLVITLAPLSLHFHKEILFPLLREYYLFL